MVRPLLAGLVCFAALFAAQLWISRRQPQPYMDELFHIPQAQSFCSSLRAWSLPPYDPSITTPPLLYLPVPVLHSLSFGVVPCTPFVLRLQSAAASALTVPIYSHILSHLHALLPSPKSPPPVSALSLMLFLHPVSLFYSHLFYTDPLSLVLLLLSYLLYLCRRPIFSSLASFLASLTRQTSIIWHFFIGFQTLLRDISPPLFPHLAGNLLPLLRTTLWPHLLAGLVYAVFLVANNGIALGDRQHHTATLHWAMAPYFFGFHALSYLPFQLAAPQLLAMQVKLLIRVRWVVTSTLIGLAFGLCIWKTGDYAHPFALSDNRHYVFYIYRKWLLKSTRRRLALIPFYTWGAVSPLLEAHLEHQTAHPRHRGPHASKSAREETHGHQELLGDVMLCLCAMACVIPAGLLEPRYFSVGSTIWAVRRAGRYRGGWHGRAVWAMVGVLAAVNVALLYVFVEKPFERAVDSHMPGDLSPGRFMF